MEISKTSTGLKGLVSPDTVSTEVDIHQDGVTMVKSLCYFCHANCGVLAYVKDGDVIKIEGDPDYSNQGGLCCRGTSALLHVNHPARINHALKRVGAKGEGKWERDPVRPGDPGGCRPPQPDQGRERRRGRGLCGRHDAAPTTGRAAAS